MCRAVDATRHLVVAGENRRRPVAPSEQLPAAGQPGLICISAEHGQVGRKLQAVLRQSGDESLPACVRGAKQWRPGDVGNAPVSKLRQPPGGRRSPVCVMSQHESTRLVELGARDAHVGTISTLEQLREPVVLGHRGGQDDSEETQALHEGPHVVEKGRTTTVTRPDHQFVAPISQGIEDAQVNILHVLRVGIVVNHADQEGTAECEAASLRVRLITVLGDDGLDSRAGFLVDVGCLVDDPRDGLFRDSGELRDVGDSQPGAARDATRARRLAARGLSRATRGPAGCFDAAAHRLFFSVVGHAYLHKF